MAYVIVILALVVILWMKVRHYNKLSDPEYRRKYNAKHFRNLGSGGGTGNSDGDPTGRARE